MSDAKRDPSNMNFGQVDRRGFIVAAGAAAVAVYAPFGTALAAPVLGAAAPSVALDDWSIDDQWGVFPRYDAIPCPVRQDDASLLAALHPADRGFV